MKTTLLFLGIIFTSISSFAQLYEDYDYVNVELFKKKIKITSYWEMGIKVFDGLNKKTIILESLKTLKLKRKVYDEAYLKITPLASDGEKYEGGYYKELIFGWPLPLKKE